VAGRSAPSSASVKELLAGLRRVLEHEQRLGFANTAVSGGLNRFIDHWSKQWPEGSRAVAQQVAASFADYSLAGQAARRRAIEAALSFTLESTRPSAQLAAVSPAPLPDPAPATPTVSPNGETRRANPVEAREVAQSVTSTATKAVNRRRRAASAGTTPADMTKRRDPVEKGDELGAPIEALRGVGPEMAKRLARLEIYTIRDLLYHFPRRHLDYRAARLISDLTFEEYETILATVWRVKVEERPGGLVIIRAIVGDESGTAEAIWFRRKDYISRELPENRTVVLSGECRLVGGRPVFRDPDWEHYSNEDTVHTARLVPVYPLVEGLNGRQLRRIVKQAVDRYAHLLVDYLPLALRGERSLLDLPSAIAQAHFPDSDELHGAARRRLAFDELLVIQLGLLARRRSRIAGDPAPALVAGDAPVEAFLDSLPFQLTGAQRHALDEVRRQLAETRPMALLLEGDVGSGKTVVAAAAAVQAVANGFQTAVMAPTEILAEQHHRTLQRLYSAIGPEAPTVALLTGSVKGAERRQVYAAIREGKVSVVTGTQALVQEQLEFARLGLVVVDEQHRFGVIQRDTLRQKGYNPHVLAMTATPIPRSLALTLYGDLDVQRLDELPPGRQVVKTRHLQPTDRPRAYEFVRREIASGHQAFIVCPLVDESSRSSEARAATAEHERLSADVFPSLRLGLLHGRMKPAEKETVMRQFQQREFDILVTTAVIEVGIDIPNATVMLIEGANRFGLAQLHQFRGRVGRGADQSYCLLISDSLSLASGQRLQLVEDMSDGFALAEKDLELRGPGEFFGTRQSGLPDLKMAKLSDVANVRDSRDAARGLFEVDPDLAAPDHRLLRLKVAEFWERAPVSS
jgi:ATP-dependent DNA helicase RecG